jgi:hypothetical protein
MYGTGASIRSNSRAGAMNTVENAGGLAPDLVVPIIGYRQWRLTAAGLTSMYDDEPWSGGTITAHCDRGHSEEEVPAQDCSCGVYAYYDPRPRTASAATPDLIGGAVVVWGRVEAHMYGLRGRHARIVALELPLSCGRKRRAVIEAANQIGVSAVPHRSLRAVALKHGAVLPRSLRPKKTLTLRANAWTRLPPA